jgi:hypothetical protein
LSRRPDPRLLEPLLAVLEDARFEDWQAFVL